MRIDVKKYLFMGIESNKKAFFKVAQELGIVHFIPSCGKEAKGTSSDIQHAEAAIKILNSLPPIDQEELDNFKMADEVITKILHYKEELDEIHEKERILHLEIVRVAPFGSYSKKDLEWLEKYGHRKIQFFCAKHGFETSDKVPDEAIHITSEGDLSYFITINKERKQYDKMMEIVPEGSLNELEHKYRLLQKEAHDAEVRLKHYARYNKYLHRVLIEKNNLNRLSQAQNYSARSVDSKIFSVEGWVPEDKIDILYKATRDLNVYIEPIAIENHDAIPTYLENEGLARIGEDLVNIYDTPSVADKDPSLWVLGFFALFFSMIIGDGGYGLILLLAALFAKKKMGNTSQEGKRFLKLSMILAASCMVWGLMTTSFFGITISPDSPIRKLSVITWLAEKKAAYHFTAHDLIADEWIEKFPSLQGINDPTELMMKAVTVDVNSGITSYEMLGSFSNDILLELALFIGVIHVCLSMLRNIRGNLSNIGWILFIMGCYLYIPTFLEATSLIHYAFGIDPARGAEAGYWLTTIGIGIAMGFALIRDKFFGLLEGMNILQIFGDVMSYLRLYALGLSGALVVNTTNELASGLPLVLAALVLIIAHGINIILCIMGGVIHGLRLNFLEWYHYSFEGGGKLFNPLKKIEVE